MKMAIFSSLEASCLAPTYFRLSSSFDSNNGAISVAVEHCQLCGGSKRPFYCESCIRKGDFAGFGQSKTEKSERYADKLLKWQILKKERLKYLEKVECVVAGRDLAERKKSQLRLHQERVKLLKDSLQKAQSKLQADKDELVRLQEGNQKKHTKVGVFGAKKKKINQYTEQTIARIAERKGCLKLCEKELFLRREHIENLFTYIFPISEVQPKSDTDIMAMSTVSALAEARHTSYIRGRWILTDNGGEHQYRIVAPTLPGNGDYSAYIICLLENKESGPDADLGQRNPAYTISAALSLTTQLVNLLAYFLDVNLPNRLCYSEFCGNDLNEKQFHRAVYKLNRNVLHLCFTQSVKPEQLHPRHTIHNILVLLKSPDLGRCGFFTITPELMQSIDASPSGMSSAIDLESSDEEVGQPDSTEQEWERVPVTLPEAPVQSSYFTSTQVPPRATMGREGHTSITGGLLSSTAASISSVASFIWGRGKDNK